ncbi:MAG: SCO family protein [Phycisphaerales bacterium]
MNVIAHRRHRGMTRADLIVWVAMFVICAVAIVIGFLRSSSLFNETADEDSPLVRSTELVVPEFRMTTQAGEAFSSAELEGDYWIVDFIFTNCAGPCPLMTTRMSELQDDLADVPGLRFVSISVDPARDTPEALRAYANLYGADFENWVFLTGDYRETQRLALDAFKLLVENPRESSDTQTDATDDAPTTAPGSDEGTHSGPILHSVKFVLVDPAGRIVDWYSGTDTEALDRLRADVRRLAGEG